MDSGECEKGVIVMLSTIFIIVAFYCSAVLIGNSMFLLGFLVFLSAIIGVVATSYIEASFRPLLSRAATYLVNILPIPKHHV